MFNKIKKITLGLLAVVLLSSAAYSQHDDPSSNASHEPKGVVMADGILYGKDFDPTMKVIEFSDIMKDTKANDGQTIVIRGKVADVCQKMGCWMTMSDGTQTARVLTSHEFLLPKDIAGREAIVIGQFNISEIDEDVAKHYNDESKNPEVKTENIKGKQKGYEIQAIGIKILN